MAGPWEQYQAQPASGAAPWVQYGGQGGGEYGFAPAPPEAPKPASPDPADIAMEQDRQTAEGMKTPGSLDRIVSAAVEGAKAPAFLTPEAKARAEADNQQTWVGRNFVSPVVSLGELPFRALNALGGGLGQAAYEAGSAISGPSGGRSAYMLNQLLPSFGAFPEAPRVAIPRSLPEPSAPTRFVQEHYNEPVPGAYGPPTEPYGPPLPQYGPPGPPEQFGPTRPPQTPGATPIPEWLGGGEYRPPGVGAPSRPQLPAAPTNELMGSPPADAANVNVPGQARSVGAAITPANTAAMPAPEVAIARSQAENNKLLEQQQPGVQDLNQYVANSNPTVAQIEQTVHASREDKNLRNLNTDVSQEAREVADRNNTARQTHYADNAGSQYDVYAATQARDAQLDQDIGAAFRHKGVADAQPIVAVGRSILDGPDGKIDPVVRVVNNVMDKLRDKNGNLETDPAMLWGVRKQINLMLSKEAAIENPTNQAAARQLMQLREAVDAAIEPAAQGFGAALKNYSDASRPIDAMELLQGREAKLYDSQNRMQYSKVQQMMREAVAARHPDAPLNPWKSLSDDQMQRLWALRDDLRRSASAEDLARASGSDSVPNMIDMAKRYVGVGVSSLPVLGPMTLRVKGALEPLLAAREARQQRTRGMEMLYPNPQQYPLRNPLAGP